MDSPAYGGFPSDWFDNGDLQLSCQIMVACGPDSGCMNQDPVLGARQL
ncbi:hypothetical protein BMF35_a2305 [Aurantiacibacter gangjinensis]|nr:hypothetical protein BMF35_a2305 [Aurantiacibacter gangjinensis]